MNSLKRWFISRNRFALNYNYKERMLVYKLKNEHRISSVLSVLQQKEELWQGRDYVSRTERDRVIWKSDLNWAPDRLIASESTASFSRPTCLMSKSLFIFNIDNCHKCLVIFSLSQSNVINHFVLFRIWYSVSSSKAHK